MFQYLHAQASANILKNKPKALNLHLNQWLAVEISKVPSHHPDSRGSSWKQIKKGRGRGEQNRLLEADPAFWLFGPNSHHTIRSWWWEAPNCTNGFQLFFFVEQSVRKSSSRQQIKHLLPPCLQNERWHTLLHLGLPQHEQSREGVHHDINSLAEQGRTSRALSHCFRRTFIAPTTVWTPCAQRAADEGLHSQSSGACSCYVSPKKKKKPHQTGYFSGMTWPGAKCYMSSVFIVIKAEGSRHGFLQVFDVQRPWEI